MVRKSVAPSASKNLVKKVISRIYLLACITGLTIQVVTVSISYFEYETQSKLNIHVSYDRTTPDLTMCVKFRDLRASNMTIRQVLNMSPNVTTSTPIISKCMTRSNQSYDVSILDPAACFNVISVTKSVYQEFVCYQMSLRPSLLFPDLKKVMYSRKWPRMLLMFFMDQSFMGSIRLIKPLIHDHTFTPYISSTYGMTFEVRDAKHSTFKCSYTVYQIQRLASPYKSNCRNYTATTESGRSRTSRRFMTRESCIQECLMKRLMRATGLLPFTSFVSLPLDHRQITMMDLMRNDSLSQTLTQQESMCEGECRQLDCDVSFFITHTESLLEQESKVIVFTPNSPDILVHEEIAFPLVDFLIFIASCFGSWLGLSFLHFNPINVYEKFMQIANTYKRRNRMKKRDFADYHRKHYDLVMRNNLQDDHSFLTRRSLFNSRRLASPPLACKEYCRHVVSFVDHKHRREVNDLKMQINLLTMSMNRFNILTTQKE